MNDISGFGISVQIVASNTFPSGFIVTQFADDADPLDSAAIQVADKAMGLNGDLVTWAKAQPLPMVLNVIPGSDDDLNLSALLEANRVSRGKRSARDVITAIVSYPDGTTETRYLGKMTDGMPTRSVASSGRMKTRPYTFAFEDRNTN